MSLRSLAFKAILIVVVAFIVNQSQLLAQVTFVGDSSCTQIVAATSPEGVRFTALGLVHGVRLEILNRAGDRVYDSAFSDGSLLDWKLDDGFGNRLPDGLYGCLITTIDLAGGSTRRRAAFWLKEGVTRFETGLPSNPENSDPTSNEGSIFLLENAEFPIIHAIHDGREGRIISGKGGLSFRSGDPFAGRDVEMMRLTPDGKLGIGVEEPSAQLDVAGVIRASEGFQFSDGTILRMEGGYPVLVTRSHLSSSDSPTDTAGKQVSQTSRFVSSNRGFSVLTLSTGSPLRVLGWETGNNTTYGDGSGSYLKGTYNSYFGYQAGNANDTGHYNSFVGAQAGSSNVGGDNNAFFGYRAGYANSAGSYNSFFGSFAGTDNTTGAKNSFFGRYGGTNNVSGNENSALGYWAGYQNTTGNNNVFLGSNAGGSNTTEHNNTFIGAYSKGITGITNATAIGHLAQVTQSNSLVLGSIAGQNTATEDTNVGIGTTAPLYRLTVSGDIDIEGNGVIRAAGIPVFATSAQNLAVGPLAGFTKPSGNFNSFFGHGAGYSTTTGGGNSFVGLSAGHDNTTGSYNSFIGYSSGAGNIGGNNNTFIGNSSGLTNSTGNNNVFVGSASGLSNTTGADNAFVGAESGRFNTTGLYNSFIGYRAGNQNTIGHSNSSFGDTSGYNNTSGNGNTFLGSLAGTANTEEHYNTFVGSWSDGFAGVTSATAIGFRAKVTQSNSLVLGSINGVNDATADTSVGIGTTAPAGPFHVKRGGNEILFAGANGKIGIGTSAPDRPLQIVSTPSANAELHIGGAGDEAKDVFSGMGVDLATGPSFNFGYSGFSFGRSSGFFNVRPDASAAAPNPSLRFLTGNQQRMIITNLGRVGIGTTSPQEALHVIGNARISGTILYGTADISIPDYVFDPDYRLMPVADLERFLATEKHLPNVPSASEIKEKGLSLSDFQMKLLEKIEELTLYTVQQHRAGEAKDAKISTLETKVATIPMLEAKNIALEARLAAIEQMLARQQEQR